MKKITAIFLEKIAPSQKSRAQRRLKCNPKLLFSPRNPHATHLNISPATAAALGCAAIAAENQ
jgi:hypothetical protein